MSASWAHFVERIDPYTKISHTLLEGGFGVSVFFFGHTLDGLGRSQDLGTFVGGAFGNSAFLRVGHTLWDGEGVVVFRS